MIPIKPKIHQSLHSRERPKTVCRTVFYQSIIRLERLVLRSSKRPVICRKTLNSCSKWQEISVNKSELRLEDTRLRSDLETSLRLRDSPRAPRSTWRKFSSIHSKNKRKVVHELAKYNSTVKKLRTRLPCLRRKTIKVPTIRISRPKSWNRESWR